MPLSQNLDPPVILFAGRPLASRKGLATLIDALAILENLEAIPAFLTWIVGGGAEEQAFLKALPNHHPSLARLQRQGRWMAWGRVETTSMAELYARSTVTVAPSTFEQFGLVAIEAMACGCPVIASRTGGLQEIVVPGLTGELFPVDDAAALAGTLSGYLRNPQKRTWQGHNARLWAARFHDRKVYDDLYALVVETTEPAAATADTLSAWRTLAIEDARNALETLIGAPVHAVANISAQSQTSARLDTAHGPLYAKIVHPRPYTLSMLVPLPEALRPPVQPREIVARYRLFQGSGLVPPLVASSDDGLIVTEWCASLNTDERHCGLSGSDAFIHRFAEFGRLVADPATLAAYEAALAAFASDPSADTIGAVDEASADLNSALGAGVRRFHRTHPQVELYRLLWLLDRRIWPLPMQTAERLRSAAGLLLQSRPIIRSSPLLCHGSLKPAHLLWHDGRPVACDLDNSLFAVGPLDSIHWLYGEGDIIKQLSLADAAATLRERFPDEGDFTLALSWLVVYIAHRILNQHLHGQTEDAARHATWLAGIYEAVFRSEFI